MADVGSPRQGSRSRLHTPGWNLALGTLAFALCFSAWGLIAPLAKKFQDDLELSSTRTAMLIAIPVVLGSLLRIPLGVVDRPLRRPERVRRDARRLGGAGRAARLRAQLLGAARRRLPARRSPARRSRSGSRSSPGGTRTERQGFALGVYGVGNIGTAVAAFSAPAIYEHCGQASLGWICGRDRSCSARGFCPARSPRRVRARRRAPRYLAVVRAGWRLYRLAFFYFITFGGFVAMSIFLPKLLKDWFGYSLVDAGAARRRVHDRRDARPAGRRLARRPLRRATGARARLRRGRRRRGRARLDRARDPRSCR